MKIDTTVLLAAGQSTRMRSHKAKVLHQVCGRPLIYYPIRIALEISRQVIVVVGHQADEVKAEVSRIFPRENILFVQQREQLGTAHAVKEVFDNSSLELHGQVLLLYGDVPLFAPQFVEAMQDKIDSAGNLNSLLMVTISKENPYSYGRIVRDRAGLIKEIVEESELTKEQKKIKEVNPGIYLVKDSVLRELLPKISNQNSKGEYYLTDLIKLYRQAGGKVKGIEEKSEGSLMLGINTRAELAQVAALLRERINQVHLEAGVTMVDPASTYIDQQVKIGKDTVIYPNVHLRGNTTIGENCRLDTGVVIMDSQVADHVQVKPYVVIDSSKVGKEVKLGPFSHLRPASNLAERVHVGNFVETKKTSIGLGSKANHLSYLGDAFIGEGVNVGAGTITCNYDGVNKHPTTIDDGVFIGSGTQLVAPVHLKKNAYVAAGATVTHEVPSGALAISRCRQKNIEGYVEKRKQTLSREQE